MANDTIATFITKQLETRSVGFGKSVRSTAQTLHTIAGELRNDAMTHGAAEFAERGADVIDGIGKYLEQSDLETMTGDAEDFSRERPWTMASIGVAAGLLAARLVKSTAARRRARPKAGAARAYGDEAFPNPSASNA